jgi:hypothetical protein
MPHITHTYMCTPDDSWPHQGAITFENTVMRYREGLDVALKGVHAAVEPGEKVSECVCVSLYACGCDYARMHMLTCFVPLSHAFHTLTPGRYCGPHGRWQVLTPDRTVPHMRAAGGKHITHNLFFHTFPSLITPTILYYTHNHTHIAGG